MAIRLDCCQVLGPARDTPEYSAWHVEPYKATWLGRPLVRKACEQTGSLEDVSYFLQAGS